MYRATSCRRTVTAGRSRACAVDLVFGVSAVASGGRRHPCGGIRPSVVQIDPSLVDDLGRTNLQRMESGLAPIGPDGR